MPNLTWKQKRQLLKFFAPSIKQHPDWPVVISEGDSWFSFPAHHNVIDHLDTMAGRSISLLRLERSGDELLSILHGKQTTKLAKRLRDFPVQALLLSGGGNDILGAGFGELLKDVPTGSGEQFLDKPLARCRIQQLKYAYLELARIRDRNRPGCVIYAHGYDYAIPSGKPAKMWGLKFGPWLKPHFDKHGASAEDGRLIIRWLIDEFNKMLESVADRATDFVHVDHRGTLSATDWNDEIHPKRAAFRKIAENFAKPLRGQFGSW